MFDTSYWEFTFMNVHGTDLRNLPITQHILVAVEREPLTIVSTATRGTCLCMVNSAQFYPVLIRDHYETETRPSTNLPIVIGHRWSKSSSKWTCKEFMTATYSGEIVMLPLLCTTSCLSAAACYWDDIHDFRVRICPPRKHVVNNRCLCGIVYRAPPWSREWLFTRSLMTHASVPLEQRQKLGLTDNLVRISVGLEDIYTLLQDLDQALDKIWSRIDFGWSLHWGSLTRLIVVGWFHVQTGVVDLDFAMILCGYFMDICLFGVSRCR